MNAQLPNELHVVTGAFGYSGKYIARRLLDAGRRVRTLTNSPERPNPFGDAVEAHPFNFDNPDKLAESLRGATVLYNTYWVRFNHANFPHVDGRREHARSCSTPRKTPAWAGSSTSASRIPRSIRRWSTFRGKARLERTLIDRGLSYAILRPGGALRRGRHPHQQHRLGAATSSRCSSSSATANTACSRSTSTISPDWPSNRAQDRERHHRRHRPRDLHLSQAGADDRRRHRQTSPAYQSCRRLLGYLAGKLVGWLVGDVMTHPRRNPRPDEQPALRQLPARRRNQTQRLDPRARRRIRRALRQRIVAAEESREGV